MYNLEVVLCLFVLVCAYRALLDDIRGDFKCPHPFGQMELGNKIHPALPQPNPRM
jgi:hypothetical protein